MSDETKSKIAELHALLEPLGSVAVAVSGGVDSLTLAYAAHLQLGANAVMFHAVSPAVPREATERTRRFASQLGWRLQTIDAGEFTDARYLENPSNRCFFCKTNVYGSIADRSDATIVSGTNLDDLTDTRPGLEAAKLHGVRHPYVEAEIGKRLVRAIATAYGLEELAELPASPCLSSRIETGIEISAPALRFVHAVETLVSRRLSVHTVRCRVRRSGVVIELDEHALALVAAGDGEQLADEIDRLGELCGFDGPVRFERYRMGSAFLAARL